MACRKGCPTQDHRSWGECARQSGIRVGRVDATTEKRWDRELDEYRAARRQGIQPEGTRLEQTRAALDASDALGRPFDAGVGVPTIGAGA